MSFFVRNNKWEFVAVGLLIGVLTLLGVLQYNWLGEISDAERERRQKTLSVSADNLTGEFDREITRLFIQLQINPNGKALPENYHRRYERWQATTLYPRLVSKVFFAFRDENGNIRLVVYDATAQHFQPSDWIAPLSKARSAIERGLSTNEPAAGSSTEYKSIPDDLLLIPAAKVDLSNLNLNQPSSAGTNFALQRVRRIGYTIILLDSDYLKHELLPSLTARYFTNSQETNDYRIFIREHSSGNVLYQSTASATDAPNKNATVRDFFRVKLTEIGNLIPASPQNAESSGSDSSQNRISSGGIIIAAGGQTNASRIQSGEQAASLIGGFEPRWQLIAEYDGGSLDSIIGRTRRRNTLISGVILLLLGVSGAWLLILSNRSRVFARHQKDFVASVSHELRTPLAVIRSLSENLADGIISDGEQIREYGTVINNEEHRLSAMVEQMLGFAAQSSPARLEKKAQNVTEIIEAALADHRRELQNLDFVIEKNIAEGLPKVAGDFDALRRAAGNLIGNAIKYSGKARVIKVQAQSTGDQKSVEISVEDSGAGISARDLPNIFDLFYRGQAAINEQIKGSGIGLSLVKQIVEAHGGTVSVSSEINRGSVFTIKLSALEPSAIRFAEIPNAE